ncbi:group 1 glycosyl transferase [Gluconobacter oxydans NBRC 3293]|uniref:Group 1 glycosyl transferase n=2 Tax=Gluconobacter oxydans TaxID=442 RepID=A0A829X0K6_GLUOY|nr:group 1 glycosyl transferase [Gluconobacter oxydans NBRC 3293]
MPGLESFSPSLRFDMSFLLSTKSKSQKIMREANIARDQKKWSQAADLYKKALEGNLNKNKRFAALVQLGNCLKESGDLSSSLDAYNEAMKIFPKNSDLHLQMGHLFKIMGRTGNSVLCYRRAVEIDPNNKDALLEIERNGDFLPEKFSNFGGSSEIENVAGIRTIWLDVTDFIDYAKVNVSLSGIQRVLANLALYIQEANIPGYRIVPIVPEYDRFRVLSVQVNSFLDLVKVFDDLHVSQEKILKCLDKVYKTRVEASLEKDDVLVVAGSFWIYPHYDAIMHMRQIGVRFGLFVHDLIQIRMPEYVEKAAHDKFNIQFSDALDLTDFILANSEYVAEDIRCFLLEKKNYSVPVKAVVLPTELRTHSQNIKISNRDITDMSQIDYVICVSTIEIRKNHTLLIRVWEKLREEFGDDAPALVFVGKWGWEIDELRRYIEERGYVGDWLFIFNGISDTEMEYLYKHSLFSIYPSFAEGFGLPIGESLVYGKPCIASSTTSMPEVGGKFVRYIDPFDWKSSYPVIRQVIVDRDDLTQWQKWIEKDFTPRTWHDFCDEFYRSIAEYGRALLGTPPKANCPLPQGQFVLGGTHDILNMAHRNEKIITFRSARHLNWHPANHWGAWSQKRRSEIQFISDCAEGEIIDIFLRLHRESSRDMDPVVLINAGTGDHAFRLSEHPTLFKLSGRVTGGGVVRVFLNARGKFPSAQFFIGWSGISYCPQGDADILIKTYEAMIQPGRLPSEVPVIMSETVSLPEEKGKNAF